MPPARLSDRSYVVSTFYRIRLEPLGKVLEVAAGTPLQDLLFSYGVEFPCGGRGVCGGCRVKVLEGDVPVDEEHRRALERLGLHDPWRLACRTRVTGDMTLEVGQFDTIILADSSPFRFRPQEGRAVAVDVGTTTLVAQLVDLRSGRVVAAETALNPQARYGGDIISRITAAVQQGKADLLTRLLREAVATLVQRLMAAAGGEAPQRILLAGNTVMHHLFCGLDLTPLAAYPFETPHGGSCSLPPALLGLPRSTEVLFLPILGSFVGSDLLAGIVATGMTESDRPRVLVDLGTNGEIVAGHRGRIVCASTAAGPAFEGTNIEMGMRATTGAISSVQLRDGVPQYHVLGNVEPRGICGSGLIDAVAVFLERGDLDSGGRILRDEGRLPLTGTVSLTQKDVRELQLAKSAIATGMQILLEELDVAPAEVEQIYIAGAFGTFIDLAHTRRIGLLPYPDEKIVKMGNTSLLGTKMLLFEDAAARAEEIRKVTRHIPLEGHPRFQDLFAENILFAPLQEEG